MQETGSTYTVYSPYPRKLSDKVMFLRILFCCLLAKVSTDVFKVISMRAIHDNRSCLFVFFLIYFLFNFRWRQSMTVKKTIIGTRRIVCHALGAHAALV